MTVDKQITNFKAGKTTLNSITKEFYCNCILLPVRSTDLASINWSESKLTKSIIEFGLSMSDTKSIIERDRKCIPSFMPSNRPLIRIFNCHFAL